MQLWLIYLRARTWVWQGLTLRLGTTEQVLRKLLNPESRQMMTMKHPERKQTSSCDFVCTKSHHRSVFFLWLLAIGYLHVTLPLTKHPGKHSVPFFKANVAGFRGCQLMEINSNGCFPGTFIVFCLLSPMFSLPSRNFVKQAWWALGNPVQRAWLHLGADGRSGWVEFRERLAKHNIMISMIQTSLS